MTEQEQIQRQIDALQEKLNQSKTQSLLLKDFGNNNARKALLRKSFRVQLAKPKQRTANGKRKLVFKDGLPQTKFRHCVAVEIMATHGMTNAEIAKVMKAHGFTYFDTEAKVTKKRASWRTLQTGEKKPYIQTIINSTMRYGKEVEENLKRLGILS